MLLEHEKNGNGPKRLARAGAFLEAASVLTYASMEDQPVKHARRLAALADQFRDMAYAERQAYDASKENQPQTA
jgi:hypothetical protein